MVGLRWKTQLLATPTQTITHHTLCHPGQVYSPESTSHGRLPHAGAKWALDPLRLFTVVRPQSGSVLTNNLSQDDPQPQPLVTEWQIELCSTIGPSCQGRAPWSEAFQFCDHVLCVPQSLFIRAVWLTLWMRLLLPLRLLESHTGAICCFPQCLFVCSFSIPLCFSTTSSLVTHAGLSGALLLFL